MSGARDLRVVGAGLGRTGTRSLKDALERLLGGRCYHMMEVFPNRDRVIPLWAAAAVAETPDLDPILDGYAAAVDWPAAGFWKELAAANPEALVLLSERESAEAWWRSADRTIWDGVRREIPGRDFVAMFDQVAERTFTARYLEREPAMAAYDRHNSHVRATAPADRLLVWRPGDGWEPICERLGVPVPDEPFPHQNSAEEFLARRQRQASGSSASSDSSNDADRSAD